MVPAVEMYWPAVHVVYARHDVWFAAVVYPPEHVVHVRFVVVVPAFEM